MEKGFVYLIQPGELIDTNRYKIGSSNEEDLSGFHCYENGTRYIFIMECSNPYDLEYIIKTSFKKKNLIYIVVKNILKEIL